MNWALVTDNLSAPEEPGVPESVAVTVSVAAPLAVASRFRKPFASTVGGVAVKMSSGSDTTVTVYVKYEPSSRSVKYSTESTRVGCELLVMVWFGMSITAPLESVANVGAWLTGWTITGTVWSVVWPLEFSASTVTSL